MSRKKTINELDAQLQAIDEAHLLISFRLYEALLEADPAAAKKSTFAVE